MGESLWRIALLLAGIVHHTTAKHHPQSHIPVLQKIPDGIYRVRVRAWYDPDGGVTRATTFDNQGTPSEVLRKAITTVWTQGGEMMEITVGHDRIGQPVLPIAHRRTPPQQDFRVEILANDGKLSYGVIQEVREEEMITT